VYSDLVRDIQSTQFSSFLVATAVASTLLVAFLRALGGSLLAAVGWGSIGMFSTTLPILVTLGIMGFAGIDLDMGTAMVAAIMIGIAVDDTIHLLVEFQRRRALGDRPATAMEGAVLQVGQAVTTTSLALAAGFFVLTLSSWQSISSFGFLSGVVILGALAAVLVVLPALVSVATGAGETDELEDRRVREELPPRTTRVWLALLALLPPTLVLLPAALDSSDPSTRAVLTCRVMRNGVVPVIAGSDPRCTLDPLDRVLAAPGQRGWIPINDTTRLADLPLEGLDSIALRVERRGEVHVASVPIASESRGDRIEHAVAGALAAALVLAFALRVFWQSSARAARAMLLLASFVSAELISILCSTHGEGMDWVGAPMGPMIAASLAHLALTFPREGRLVQQFPRLQAVPYAAGLLLAGVDLRGLGFDPTFWALSERFTLSFLGAGAVLLWLACIRAVRDSSSALERARARLLLLGSVGVPLAVLATQQGWGRGLPGGHLTPFAMAVTLFLAALGHAVIRYDLFDFTVSARRSLGRAAWLATIGGSTAAAAWLVAAAAGRDGLLLSAAAGIAGYGLATWLRRSAAGAFERLLFPGADLRRGLLRRHEERAARLATEDVSAQLLGRTLEAGLDSVGVAVFIAGERGWRPAYAGRESPAFRLRHAEAADRALRTSQSLHLARGDAPIDRDSELLRDAGVELVRLVSFESTRLALILLGRPRRAAAYNREEIQFVRRVAEDTAQAFCNARSLADRLAAERQDFIAHFVRGIAHDLGSALRVLERRAHRLAERVLAPAQARREAAHVEAVARDLAATVYELAASNGASKQAALRRTPLHDVIRQAIARVDRAGEGDRVLVSLAPGIPPVADAQELVRVLANLLENALAASPPDGMVWIYGTAAADEVRIEVSDRGSGMSPRTLALAFDPSFTTHLPSEGKGMGLAIAREVVEALGGKIELESVAGLGSRAVLRLPRADPDPAARGGAGTC
jgi:signal transduction histidine kinase